MPKSHNQVESWKVARVRFDNLLVDLCNDRTDEDPLRIARNTGVMEAVGVIDGIIDRSLDRNNHPEITALLEMLSGMVAKLIHKP